MHARLLAASSLSLAAAGGAALAAFPHALTLVPGVAAAIGATVMLAWRDGFIEETVFRTPAPPAPLPVPTARPLPMFEPRREFTRIPDAANDQPLGRFFRPFDFVVPEGRLSERTWCKGDLIEFVYHEFERGEVTYRGVIRALLGNDNAKVDVLGEGMTVAIPLAALIYVGDA